MQVNSKYHRIFQADNFRQISLMLLIGVLAQNLSGCTEKKQGYPNAGDAFPLAALNQIKILGNKMPDLKNKTLLINFWATWCTPCRKEMPHLQKLSEALDQDKFAVIGISVDDDANLVKEFLLQYKIRFANFQDENLEIATRLLGIQAFPETFIVAPSGVIIKRISGEQIWDEKFLKLHLESSRQVDAHSTLARAFG
jgi:thiol-disulfide isomerase/thioredoxin